MSIYISHLSSIPFKSEPYLKRYIKFIESCLEANKSLPPDVYTEEHHILPKADSMFPQFIDLRQHPWNAARLTARQHFIAHLMLKKAYMNVPMCRAVTLMAGKNSRYYEQAKIDLAAALSALHKGKPKSEEARMKMSIAATGKPKSDEARKNMSIAKQNMSDETKRNMSIASTGRTHSDETKMKLSKALKGQYQGQKHSRFKGFYQTPFGTFDSALAASGATNGTIPVGAIIRWSKKDNLKVISNVAYGHSQFLQNNYAREDVVGKKTFNDLGFSFIPK